MANKLWCENVVIRQGGSKRRRYGLQDIVQALRHRNKGWVTRSQGGRNLLQQENCESFSLFVSFFVTSHTVPRRPQSRLSVTERQFLGEMLLLL